MDQPCVTSQFIIVGLIITYTHEFSEFGANYTVKLGMKWIFGIAKFVEVVMLSLFTFSATLINAHLL